MSKAPKGSKQAKINDALPIFKSTKIGDVIGDILSLLNTGMLTKAGLAIHGSASAVVTAGSAFVALVNGVAVSVAAGDLSALVGTLPTANSAAWAFFVNGAGTVTTGPMTAAASTAALALAALQSQIIASLPQPIGAQQPVQQAMIGFIIVSNATGSNFIGGTTALDTGSLTVTYYDSIGGLSLAPIVNIENRLQY